MADKRETFAGSLSGDQLGKTITVPNPQGDLVEGVLQVLVHRQPGVVALFFDNPDVPEIVSADAIAVVS